MCIIATLPHIRNTSEKAMEVIPAAPCPEKEKHSITIIKNVVMCILQFLPAFRIQNRAYVNEKEEIHPQSK